MRIVRYIANGAPAWGAVDGDELLAATGTPFADFEPGEAVGPLSEARLLAPVAPKVIMCVGRNYKSHAEEFGNEVPGEPILFLKPPTSVVGPGAEVHYPELSERVDPEVELCLVIGKRAHRVSEEDAFSVIGGYTIGNDFTARDIQKSDDGAQWTRGKGFHTFCPLGPWVDTEIDPGDLRVTLSVDGELRQDGRTRDFIWDIPYLIRYITRFAALEPGDVIMTGTPQGVGPVKVGQTISAEIEGLGRLENRVVPEP
jgi:2-keto-4-pentenoate hydratase/2-oxohepta-3-ene-1,7-dioic acid hydratase in catechol pathway